jgi:glycosyltransferase involved in cell wall biosynthesis
MSGSKRLAVLLPDMRGGGAERVGLRLINDFLAAGHEVDLVLLEEKGELLELLPPTVKVFGMNAPRVRGAIKPLARYFRERNPYAVQISMWPYTIAGLLAHHLARSGSRVVLSDHATLSRHYRPGSAAYFLLTKTVRLFYPWADARVIVAEHAADDLARISGIDRASIEVIYNPVSAPPSDQRRRPDIEALWGVQRKPRQAHDLGRRSSSVRSGDLGRCAWAQRPSDIAWVHDGALAILRFGRPVRPFVRL